MLEMLARVSFVCFFAVPLITNVYKLQKDKSRIGSPIILQFIACAILVSTHSLIKALVDEPSLWLYILGDFAQQYGALIGYVATYQALHNKLYYPILKSKNFFL